MLFAEEKRPIYSQKFPNKSQEDIAQLIGWEWKISPEMIKEQYILESRRRLTQYRLATRSKSNFEIFSKKKKKRVVVKFIVYQNTN